MGLINKNGYGNSGQTIALFINTKKCIKNGMALSLGRWGGNFFAELVMVIFSVRRLQDCKGCYRRKNQPVLLQFDHFQGKMFILLHVMIRLSMTLRNCIHFFKHNF